MPRSSAGINGGFSMMRLEEIAGGGTRMKELEVDKRNLSLAREKGHIKLIIF